MLGGGEPHLMVTDPPYGVEYDAGWRGRSSPAASSGEDSDETGIIVAGKDKRAAAMYWPTSRAATRRSSGPGSPSPRRLRRPTTRVPRGKRLKLKAFHRVSPLLVYAPEGYRTGCYGQSESRADLSIGLRAIC